MSLQANFVCPKCHKRLAVTATSPDEFDVTLLARCDDCRKAMQPSAVEAP